MSGISDGVFRYNISANDGASTRYMATIADGSGANPVSTTASSYTAWSNGQTIFHYAGAGTSAAKVVPLIYNNTFYVGDGITLGLFGGNTSSAFSKYVRFYNNVLIKAGTGKVYLSYGHSGSGKAGSIYNEAGFKNNLIWGYDTDPAVGNYSKFDNGSGTGVAALFAAHGNKWQNPGLRIQDAGAVAELRAQRDTVFPAASFNDPADLADFTGVAQLRSRAGLFSPLSASTVTGGMEIPDGGGSAVDGAWDGPRLLEDLFGISFNPSSPPIGAAAGPYGP
jgi:hypothetical protein